MYEVYIERAAERDLKRLPVEIFQKIISRIKALSENPRPSGCRKIAGSKHDWRVRIGNYRVLYEIDARNEAIRIMRVRHRKEVYR